MSKYKAAWWQKAAETNSKNKLEDNFCDIYNKVVLFLIGKETTPPAKREEKQAKYMNRQLPKKTHKNQTTI